MAEGFPVKDVYAVSGRVIINGVDVGADVESVSIDRDIPSGMPGSSGFRSATGTVTATRGEVASDRVATPWGDGQPESLITYEWTGEPHASESIKRVRGIEVARNHVLNPDFTNNLSGWDTPTADATTVDTYNISAGEVWPGYAGAIVDIKPADDYAANIDLETSVAIPVEVGQWVAYAALVASNHNGESLFQWRATSSDGGYTYPHSSTVVAPAEGVRHVGVGQMPPTADGGHIYPRFSFTSDPAPGRTFWATRFMAAVANTEADALAQVAEYFDGDTPNVFPTLPIGSWPPQPMDDVKIVLSDGSRKWKQFTGHISDVSGSSSTRTVSFGVQDDYRSLERPVTIPALSDAMPSLVDGNHHRWIGLQTPFITDWVLRQAGWYATPPRTNSCVVSATFQGSTWPERGHLTLSQKMEPDQWSDYYPNWFVSDYGLRVSNVETTYAPEMWSGLSGRITDRPLEITQEVVPVGSDSTYVLARIGNAGQVGLAHTADWVFARYYTTDSQYATIVQIPRPEQGRVTARFTMSGSVVTAELRTINDLGQVTDVSGTHDVGTGLNGVIDRVQAYGLDAQGAFQIGFPPVTEAWENLTFQPTAQIHASPDGGTRIEAIPTMLGRTAQDILDEKAAAELAQYWIDEDGVLQWWERGLLAQQASMGTLTGADHVKELPWSHNYDQVKHQVAIKYTDTRSVSRWKRNLTLWEGGTETLDPAEEYEKFINAPDDEIWLGVDIDEWVHYSDTYTDHASLNQGVHTVLGGVAVDEDGNERTTNEAIVDVRRVTDATYVVTASPGALNSGEQVALQFPSEPEVDPALWGRWMGHSALILRGKKRVTLHDETYTSQIAGPESAPDYEHDAGVWIQVPAEAGITADYLAASLTSARATVEQLDTMPVFNLRAGAVVDVYAPEVVGLTIRALVTSNNISADFTNGSATQQVSLLPMSIEPAGPSPGVIGMQLSGHTWGDFGKSRAGDAWQDFGADRDGERWGDFGTRPLD